MRTYANVIHILYEKNTSTLDHHTEHTVFPAFTNDRDVTVRFVNRHRLSAGRRALSLRLSTLRRRPFITSS